MYVENNDPYTVTLKPATAHHLIIHSIPTSADRAIVYAAVSHALGSIGHFQIRARDKVLLV
jgi:hypothetical protein